MPNYGTVAGVYAFYPRIGSVSAVTSSTVVTFINHAEAKVEACIAGRYSVPVAGSPPLLKYAAETLATAMILRRFFSQEQENKSEWVDGMFNEVKDTLDGLVKGSLSLVDSAGAIISTGRTSSEVWSNTKGYVPTMNILDPSCQRIDRDRLIDTEDSLK